jgi:alpha-tubulin suppressor-like RCC1 family protein
MVAMRPLLAIVVVLAAGCDKLWGLLRVDEVPVDASLVDSDSDADIDAALIGITGVGTGGAQTCAIKEGRLRCWGLGNVGQLGHGNTNDIGDNELARDGGDVSVGFLAAQVEGGAGHTCALSTEGQVRCFGAGDYGRLGYGNVNAIGDTEVPSSVLPLDLGGTAKQLAVGAFHNCVVIDSSNNGGNVRCWGLGNDGRLGYGNTNNIGDDEPAGFAGDVNLNGDPIKQVVAGGNHTCALTVAGAVYCWGANTNGQLGYAGTNDIGDNELPRVVGTVSVGGEVKQLAAGDTHTCALTTAGNVVCWGNALYGQLGYGNQDNIGDNEQPAAAGNVPLGTTATDIAAGTNHTCVVTQARHVRCWGQNNLGQLGLGHQTNIGDNETPISDVPIVELVLRVWGGGAHTCALLVTGDIRCWGSGAGGQLGYGNTNDIGDNEQVSTVGTVPAF